MSQNSNQIVTNIINLNLDTLYKQEVLLNLKSKYGHICTAYIK